MQLGIRGIRKDLTFAPDNRLFLISGPSGVGKGTILSLLEQDSWIRSCCDGPSERIRTHDVRPGEQLGQYKVVNRQDFEKMIANGDMFQWVQFGENLYGWAVTNIVDLLGRGKFFLSEILPAQALSFKDQYPDNVTTIFIKPPDPPEATLKHRLITRGRESLSEIQVRLQQGLAELDLAPKFDHLFVNEDSGKTAGLIKKLLQSIVNASE